MFSYDTEYDLNGFNYKSLTITYVENPQTFRGLSTYFFLTHELKRRAVIRNNFLALQCLYKKRRNV